VYLESALTGSKAHKLYEKLNAFPKSHGLFSLKSHDTLPANISWEILLRRQ
jgi:hypothetical protein